MIWYGMAWHGMVHVFIFDPNGESLFYKSDASITAVVMC